MSRATLIAALVGPALVCVPTFTAHGQSAGKADAKPAHIQPADSLSATFAPRGFQPLGGFPTNTVTNRPFVGPQGGQEGMQKTVAGLQRTLTELQQLQLQIKQAHWNVSGPAFWQLHELLQEHYEGVSKDADLVAERLLSIGASSDGRATTIVQTSRIPEIPGGFIDGAAVVTWFVATYKVVGDEIRQAIRDTEEPDPTTANLLQGVEDAIDKYQWQVRAFIQATPTNPNTGADFNDRKPVDVPSAVPQGQPGPAQ